MGLSLMRLVFVNIGHPDMPHVASVRLPTFARAMARRGHKVILLTKTLHDNDPGDDADDLLRRLQRHDWTGPFHVAARPARAPRLQKLRAGELARPLSKVMTAWYLLRYRGVHWDWSGVTPSLEAVLATQYRPDLVWATFVSSDALVIAQRLTDRAGCPWAADLKDSWSFRLPQGLRRLTAWRFRNVAKLTANSRFHGEQGARWFGKEVKTIYDGIPEEFLGRDGRGDLSGSGLFRIVLVGGTYGEARLGSFLRALGQWADALPEEQRASVLLTYAGTDSDAVRSACARTGFPGRPDQLEVRGYLPLGELAELCTSAWTNAYLWQATTFHHKLLELMACRRPVIAFPGEHLESEDLAARLGGELHVCTGASALVATLRELWARRYDSSPARGQERLLEAFGWETQAAELERVFTDAVDEWSGKTPRSMSKGAVERRSVGHGGRRHGGSAEAGLA